MSADSAAMVAKETTGPSKCSGPLVSISYSHLGLRSSAETWNPAHARVERISGPAAFQKYQGRPTAGWMATPLRPNHVRTG